LHRLHVSGHLIPAITILVFLSCSGTPSDCSDPCDTDNPGAPCDTTHRGWRLEPDSMNLAILALDFQTYALKGVNLEYYRPGRGSCPDSLPFDPDFRPTWDFGSILFRYSLTGDTLFSAGIVWMGRGKIRYPASFTSPDSFCVCEDEIAQPPDPRRYQFYARPPREVLIAKTDSAWAAVSSLDIVHAFAEGPFRIGYYLYPPVVGMFDPAAAMWIVFLHQDKTCSD